MCRSLNVVIALLVVARHVLETSSLYERHPRQSIQESVSAENLNVDIPLDFSYNELLTEYIESAIRGQSVATDRLNEYLYQLCYYACGHTLTIFVWQNLLCLIIKTMLMML